MTECKGFNIKVNLLNNPKNIEKIKSNEFDKSLFFDEIIFKNNIYVKKLTACAGKSFPSAPYLLE